MSRRKRAQKVKTEEDPLWYKDAILYELHVRAFADSDGDGIGDFAGLTEKLDYLQDLGVTALWLLPFYPSPLRDDGYDIADYRSIHPSYGDLRQFKTFLRQAHRRGLKVITELVINHTSDEHPWFERARHARPGSAYRDFYVWSDDPDRYSEARIIFKDFETSNWTWDPVAEAYYWHRFYHHQPDLNFASARVRREVFRALDFWLGMGVDGLRLDAIPYLYERDGTNCENLPETHDFLKELRAHVDRHHANRMLLAEANQWPEDAVAYFGEGDECHMAFHFPVMPRLFMALRMEDRFPILDILQQTPAIPEAAQWAIFLRNHDELTLEMVTDEDRDYMYRVYASDPRARINLGIRRRLAPLLGNDRRRIELMNALLFSLPGTPVLYYGDEIGMGDNFYLGDRNGVRTPMQWSPDRNAGFSRANPQKLYLPVVVDPEYHYEAINVEAQQANPHSLIWWTKRLISLRKRYRAFSRGSIEFLNPENGKVLAFIRAYEEERILVVANLSRFAQYVELDLSAYAGVAPRELFGQIRFPSIGELTYLLTLAPHGFYWFDLARRERSDELAIAAPPGEAALPLLRATGGWENVLKGRARAALEAILPGVLATRRWFGGKSRAVRQVTLGPSVPITTDGVAARWLLIDVEYGEGEPETYALPLAFAAGAAADRIAQEHGAALVARLEVRAGGTTEAGLLYDAFFDESFCATLLEAVDRRKVFKQDQAELAAFATSAFRALRGPRRTRLQPEISKAEQSNTSIVFGERLILKLFRKVHPGLNPDLEIGRFLTEQAGFPHIAPVAGGLELRRGHGAEPVTLGILQGFVPNQGDAWSFTLDSLGRFFERVITRQDLGPAPQLPGEPLALTEIETPEPASELVGLYLGTADLLGLRSAELHRALASSRRDPHFAPEPFTSLYQRSLYQSMRTLTGRAFQDLERRPTNLPAPLAARARALSARKAEVLARFSTLLDGRIDAVRIRCHGDYHLGQVLYTGKDFVIIDFEGEPARALSERRIKRSALRDVAGMLRSFHYAVYTALQRELDRGVVGESRRRDLPGWALYWYGWVAARFLGSYVEAAAGASFLPEDRGQLATLLDAALLEKAIYELSYELNNRPAWVGIPLTGIEQLLEAR